MLLVDYETACANIYLDIHQISYLWILYRNDLPLLKKFLNNNWSSHNKWVIDREEALNIALRSTGSKNMHKYSIKRIILVTRDGLYPYYEIWIPKGDRKQVVYINAFDGSILTTIDLYPLGIGDIDMEGINEGIYVYIILLIPLLTISLVMLYIIWKRRYKTRQ